MIDQAGRDAAARAITHQTVESRPPTAIFDAVAQRRPLRRERHAADRHLVLLAEPSQRGPDIGLVVGDGLCRHAQPSGVELIHLDPDRHQTRGDRLDRAIQPLGDLTQGAGPMPAHLVGQIVRTLDRGHGDRNGWLENGGDFAHWDDREFDRDGLGCLSMYCSIIWEVVTSIRGFCTLTFIPKLGPTSFPLMYIYVLRWTIITERRLFFFPSIRTSALRGGVALPAQDEFAHGRHGVPNCPTNLDKAGTSPI